MLYDKGGAVHPAGCHKWGRRGESVRLMFIFFLPQVKGTLRAVFASKGGHWYIIYKV